MKWNSLFEALAALYPDRKESRRVVREAGLNAMHIAFSDTALTNWSNVLEQAEKRNKVQAIVDIAIRDYPERIEELRYLYERWRNSGQSLPNLAGGSTFNISRPIVDRRYELKTFVAALESPPQQAASIFLVQDQGGQGKSRLLELYKAHCHTRDFPVAHVDLKNGSQDPLGILSLIRRDLRDYPLSRCTTALQTAYGNIAGHSPDQQRQQWDISARALFDDLDDLTRSPQSKRFVFLFDTFEHAKLETQRWIADYVLRMATPNRLPCLIVVLAGRQVPNPTGEWESHHRLLSLLPLRLEDWLVYAELVKSNLGLEQIERCYTRYAHEPLKMAEYIAAFREVA